MAELETGHPTTGEPNPAQLPSFAQIALSMQLHEYRSTPLAAGFISHLGNLSELGASPPIEQLAQVPHIARTYVRERVAAMSQVNTDQPVWQYYHRFLEGNDGNGRIINVDMQISQIIRHHGTYGKFPGYQGTVAPPDRDQFLDRQIRYATQAEHYHRFPEIKCAMDLERQLKNNGHVPLADGLRLVLAAFGSAVQILPPEDKALPPHVRRQLDDIRRHAASQAVRHTFYPDDRY